MSTDRKKGTEDLMETLKEKPLGDALKEIAPDQLKDTFSSYINRLFCERNTTPNDVKRKGRLRNAYLNEIVNGKKTNPSRDVMIRICFGFGLDIDETQKFLRTFGAARLYARNRRDSIIIHALENKLSIDQCEADLEQYSEKPLKGG